MLSTMGLYTASSPAGFSYKAPKKDNGKPQTSAASKAAAAALPEPGKTTIVTTQTTTTTTQPLPPIKPEGDSTTTSVTDSTTSPDSNKNSSDADLFLDNKSAEWTYASRAKSAVLKENTYCPFVTVNLGFASTSNLGPSKYIPAGSSGSGSFYNYTPSDNSRTVPIAGAFVGVEYVLHPLLSMQAGLSYSQTGSYNVTGVVQQGVTVPTASSYSYKYNLSSQQFLIETKILYNKKRIHPYVSAGVGFALTKASGYTVDILPPGSATSNQFGNNTAGAFSYSVGLGFDFDVATNVRLGLGYRFADFGRNKLSNATIGSIQTRNNLGQAHFYVNELLAQFTLFL